MNCRIGPPESQRDREPESQRAREAERQRGREPESQRDRDAMRSLSMFLSRLGFSDATYEGYEAGFFCLGGVEGSL